MLTGWLVFLSDLQFWIVLSREIWTTTPVLRRSRCIPRTILRSTLRTRTHMRSNCVRLLHTFMAQVRISAGSSSISLVFRFAYVVSPYRIDPKSVNVKSVNRNYRKVLNAMSAMNVRSQFPKILTVCLREDTFYGTLWVTNDNITIQQLPSDYCGISTIEGNVLNVTFDFSYFDAHSQYLDYYPTEFQQKYKVYQSNRRARWQELDSPTSFAIKCNNDILDYSIPPFAGYSSWGLWPRRL